MTAVETGIETGAATAAVPAQRRDPAGLRSAVRGTLHLAGEPGYDALVSPWNRAVSVRPAAVLAAADAADVAACVRAAGELGLRVAVQCTGHGAAADHAGTVLVSTRALDECHVHVDERWARVGRGRAVEARRRPGGPPRPGAPVRVDHRTSASSATRPAAAPVRSPGPTAWRPTGCGRSRS